MSSSARATARASTSRPACRCRFPRSLPVGRFRCRFGMESWSSTWKSAGRARRPREGGARPARGAGSPRARAGSPAPCSGPGRSRRRPAASSSPSRRARRASRCSRSAARAATRRSGSRPGARVLGGRVVSLEQDPAKIAAWRENIAAAGLEEWAELVEGDAFETLAALRRTCSTSSSSTRRRTTTRSCSGSRGAARAGRPRRRRQRALARGHPRGVLAPRGRPIRDARQSVTVPLDRGLEVERRPRPTVEQPSADRHPPRVRMLRYRGKEVVRT